MAGVSQRSRLKSRYEQEIRPSLVERFGYSTPMQAPAISKITLNMGVGDAKQDSKVLEAATEQLATIAGQRPSVRRARKSIAAFKLREGMPVGVSVTLRGERSYEFLDRLLSIAIPRIRDFRGMNPRSFDGRGNYSLGVREQIIFPEIDYDSIDQTRGLDITITTSAQTDVEAFALLEAFGFPFAHDGRPAGMEAAVVDSGQAADPDVGEGASANGHAATEPEAGAAEDSDVAEEAADVPVLEAEPVVEEEPAVEEEPVTEVALEDEPAVADEPVAEVAIEEPVELVQAGGDDAAADAPVDEPPGPEASSEEPEDDAATSEEQ